MGFSIKMSGFDEVKKKLEGIEKKVKEINGQEVPFSELFNSSFLAKHSGFSSFDELLINGGFQVNSKEDFKAIPDNVFDEHIAKTTDFNNWEEMKQCAAQQYLKEKIF